jgi:hypothetical protein
MLAVFIVCCIGGWVISIPVRRGVTALIRRS